MREALFLWFLIIRWTSSEIKTSLYLVNIEQQFNDPRLIFPPNASYGLIEMQIQDFRVAEVELSESGRCSIIGWFSLIKLKKITLAMMSQSGSKRDRKFS